MTQKQKIKQMLDAIRKAMSECTAPEREVMDALCDEAEGWKMRLQELEAEDADA